MEGNECEVHRRRYCRTWHLDLDLDLDLELRLQMDWQERRERSLEEAVFNGGFLILVKKNGPPLSLPY